MDCIKLGNCCNRLPEGIWTATSFAWHAGYYMSPTEEGGLLGSFPTTLYTSYNGSRNFAFVPPEAIIQSANVNLTCPGPGFANTTDTTFNSDYYVDGVKIGPVPLLAPPAFLDTFNAGETIFTRRYERMDAPGETFANDFYALGGASNVQERIGVARGEINSYRFDYHDPLVQAVFIDRDQTCTRRLDAPKIWWARYYASYAIDHPGRSSYVGQLAGTPPINYFDCVIQQSRAVVITDQWTCLRIWDLTPETPWYASPTANTILRCIVIPPTPGIRRIIDIRLEDLIPMHFLGRYACDIALSPNGQWPGDECCTNAIPAP